MPRFYLPHIVSGEEVSVTDTEQLHHMRHVLRLHPGDAVTVFDMEGNEYQCVINVLGRGEAVLNIRSRKTSRPKRFELTIACAVPKRSLMDDIIDKMTQLGVDVIIPLETERGIVKLDDNIESRLERWRKISRTAAQQSQRNTLPVINEVMKLKDILTHSKDYELKLIPTLVGQSQKINQLDFGTKPARILALIGPEGDFTPQEIQQSLDAGCIPVSLGETVLRVETAAIALAAFLKFTFME